jgi:8-oxo-dGTP pyrophosphatase MutT (NUDIX family)
MTVTITSWLASGPDAVRPDDAPDWLAPLISELRRAQPSQLSTNDPAAEELSARQAAVLILIAGAGPDDATVVLTRRAAGLRDHPGEVSFPGGSWESGDASPVDTALREAAEEVGIDPAGVTPLVLLPRLFIRASGFDVTGVVGYWHHPGVVAAVDSGETLLVLSVPLRQLAEPDRWQEYVTVGWRGPSTRLDGDALLWGYTAEVLAFVSRYV